MNEPTTRGERQRDDTCTTEVQKDKKRSFENEFGDRIRLVLRFARVIIRVWEIFSCGTTHTYTMWGPDLRSINRSWDKTRNRVLAQLYHLTFYDYSLASFCDQTLFALNDKLSLFNDLIMNASLHTQVVFPGKEVSNRDDTRSLKLAKISIIATRVCFSFL